MGGGVSVCTLICYLQIEGCPVGAWWELQMNCDVLEVHGRALYNVLINLQHVCM